MEESMQESFATLQQQYIERGEKFVSDLLGQEVNFSNPSANYAPSEETINQFQQSAENAINGVAANFTGGETDATLPAPVAEGATDSVSTQQQLIQAGINEIPSFGVGNAGGDSMTGSGEGNSSTSAIDINFVPAEQGTGEIGQVEAKIGGETTTLFSFGSGGPVSPFSSDDQQTGFGSFLSSFLSNDQGGGGMPTTM